MQDQGVQDKSSEAREMSPEPETQEGLDDEGCLGS